MLDHQRSISLKVLVLKPTNPKNSPLVTLTNNYPQTPFHSLLGTPKTALSRIPFPKTQNDSSIEDVSLKPTRQEAVKKEPKSNAT